MTSPPPESDRANSTRQLDKPATSKEPRVNFPRLAETPRSRRDFPRQLESASQRFSFRNVVVPLSSTIIKLERVVLCLFYLLLVHDGRRKQNESTLRYGGGGVRTTYGRPVVDHDGPNAEPGFAITGCCHCERIYND